MTFHNLRGYFRPETSERARAFDGWLAEAVESPAAERGALLADWRHAPFAAYAHPREEHLIPLMVAAGAGAMRRETDLYRRADGSRDQRVSLRWMRCSRGSGRVCLYR